MAEISARERGVERGKQRLNVCIMVQCCCSAESVRVGRAHVYQRALASMTNPLLITQGLNNYKVWYEYDAMYLLLTIHYMHSLNKHTNMHVCFTTFVRTSH